MSCYFCFVVLPLECDVVSLYVDLSMDMFVLYVAFLTVFVNFLVKQFAICLCVFVILVLEVMKLLSMVDGALFDIHVWSSKECVCCVCGLSERLDAPSICFVCVFVCQKLSLRYLLSLCCFCV